MTSSVPHVYAPGLVLTRRVAARRDAAHSDGRGRAGMQQRTKT